MRFALALVCVLSLAACGEGTVGSNASSASGSGASGAAGPGSGGSGGSPGPENEAPTAAFTASPASGVGPLEVTFDASDSSDPDGEIVEYAWDLDGESAEGVQTTRTFDEVGCHLIGLTVTDDDGATASITSTVVVATGEPTLPPAVTIDVSPRASAVLPRDLATNEGIAHFEGTVESDGFVELRAEVLEGDTVHSTASTPLCGAAPVTFDLDVPIPAQLTAFEVRLYVVGPGAAAEPQQVHAVSDLVAGDIFVVQGQSNAVASQFSGDANENQGPFVRSFGSNVANGEQTAADLVWRTANGNAGGGQAATGQWPLRMAAAISAAHEVPIGILNGAHGGQPISFFQRNDADITDGSTNYGRLLTRLTEAGLDQSIRAILWYQGESDGAGFQVHHDGFLALKDDWAADFPGVERIYVTQVRAGCGGDLIRLQEVQRQLADDFAEITVMSTTGLDAHDGCHYGYEGGYRELGDRYAALLGRDLYGETPANDVQPPNPKSAQFAGGGSQVVLEMRHATSTLTFDAGAGADFRFEGAAATISGATVMGNKLVLDVAGNASGATGLTYLGHVQAGPWVLNENGIGLLEFFDLPIAAE